MALNQTCIREASNFHARRLRRPKRRIYRMRMLGLGSERLGKDDILKIVDACGYAALMMIDDLNTDVTMDRASEQHLTPPINTHHIN